MSISDCTKEERRKRAPLIFLLPMVLCASSPVDSRATRVSDLFALASERKKKAMRSEELRQFKPNPQFYTSIKTEGLGSNCRLQTRTKTDCLRVQIEFGDALSKKMTETEIAALGARGTPSSRVKIVVK